MTDTATPEARTAPRPTKYPMHLAVMISEPMKAEIVAAAAGSSQGEIVRRRLELGAELEEAFAMHPELEASVARLARDGSVTPAAALGTLIDFAVREAARRLERNARLAIATARAFAETTGIEPDGVSVGEVSLSLDR